MGIPDALARKIVRRHGLGKFNITFGYPSMHNIPSPDYMEKHPLGGSETAMFRLGAEFEKLGHNVSYVKYPAVVSACDIFISLRSWQPFVQDFQTGALRYLWCQDDIDQPIVRDLANPKLAEKVYANVNGVFTISHYQQRRWVRSLHLPVDKIINTTNGIPYMEFHGTEKKPWAYYSSTPFRGLDVLDRVWNKVVGAIPDAQLHVFSSMKVYNSEETPYYTALYNSLASKKGVVYHGSVGQEELRNFTPQCRALAYPCTFPETSCITAMEAMASGCTVVGTDIGALPETAWGNPLVTPEGNWEEVYTKTLIEALRDDSMEMAIRNFHASYYYAWDRIAKQWEDVFYEHERERRLSSSWVRSTKADTSH
jgi:glycosyltransferase involved in cell wall biosynthesis